MVKVCREVQCIVSCCGSTSQTRLSAIRNQKTARKHRRDHHDMVADGRFHCGIWFLRVELRRLLVVQPSSSLLQVLAKVVIGCMLHVACNQLEKNGKMPTSDL